MQQNASYIYIYLHWCPWCSCTSLQQKGCLSWQGWAGLGGVLECVHQLAL